MIQKVQKTVTLQKIVQRPVEMTQIQIVEEIVDVPMVKQDDPFILPVVDFQALMCNYFVFRDVSCIWFVQLCISCKYMQAGDESKGVLADTNTVADDGGGVLAFLDSDDSNTWNFMSWDRDVAQDWSVSGDE